MRQKAIVVTIDLLVLCTVFIGIAWWMPQTLNKVLPTHLQPFFLFLFLWAGVSIALDKYNFSGKYRKIGAVLPVIYSNFTILGLVTIALSYLKIYTFSGGVLFGTVFFTTVFELLFALGNAYYDAIKNKRFIYESEEKLAAKRLANEPEVAEALADPVRLASIRKPIVEEAGEAVYKFIRSTVAIEAHATLVLATTTRFNILNQPDDFYHNVINLKRINDIQYINKFFEAVNAKVPVGGIFIGCAETYVLRKKRILKKFPPIINRIYYAFDFIFKRVFPKLNITKQIYFFITKGHNRVLSRAETLGRLYSCGFEIIKEDFVGDLLYFVARKKREPYYDEEPTYGPLIRLKRFGKNKKIIGVFKMRTMHAYSEYLQQYVFETSSLQEGGKFKDDFRVTTAGKFMRKTWLDELPMLINLLKGDLKLVGVRPLSKHYFSLYTPEMQELRTQFKPGLIPPFYVDMPKTLEEIQESERKYLLACKKHPFITDFRYFWTALYNIIIKKARSN
jgi:lipopolysaccharide/colanic/teichoic acid biosynthesis glycosyltransferase